MAKRRAKGTGSIYKRELVKNGKKYTYWCCDINKEVNGKLVKKQCSFKTQAEAVAKLNELNHQIDTNEYIADIKMDLSTWLDKFLEDYCINQKYLTIKSYKAQINTHIKPHLGSVQLSKLNTSMIQKFYKQLAIDGKEVQRNVKGKLIKTYEPLSAKSIKNIHVILHNALEKAVDAELIRKNPTDKAVLPKVKKPGIVPLTDEQASNFIKEASKDSLGMMLQVILFTGIRESEALGLTWDCVDLTEGFITINKQLIKHTEADGGYFHEETKNGKERTIPISPAVVELLKARKKEDMENRLKANVLWEGWKNSSEQKTALVFTNELGNHLTPKTTYKHCKKICKAINAPEVTVHGLRHTYATLSLQNGDDLKTVSQHLGHSAISITADTYAHVSKRMDRESADRMQKYIESIS